MNIKHNIWYLYIRVTHPILCKLRWHRLIHWNDDIEGGDKDCWCGKEVGGGWLKKECIATSYYGEMLVHCQMKLNHPEWHYAEFTNPVKFTPEERNDPSIYKTPNPIRMRWKDEGAESIISLSLCLCGCGRSCKHNRNHWCKDCGKSNAISGELPDANPNAEVVDIETKNYETVGKPLLLDFLKEHTEFKLIPDENEYVIECKEHGLVSTGLNVAEVYRDLLNHKTECKNDEGTETWQKN